MKAFADLFTKLDGTNKTDKKVALLSEYFKSADPADAAWVLYFLIGRRQRRAISGRKLAEWATAEARLPIWLFAESYDAVGDMAETISLLLPDSNASAEGPLHAWVEQRILPLNNLDDSAQREMVVNAWNTMSRSQRFVFNKLITGSFRVGVSQKLVVRALADVSPVDVAALAHRLMGDWSPTPDWYRSLLQPQSSDADHSRPYPFCLAFAYEDTLPALGDIAVWQLEWKWDGIRAQIIRRKDQTFIWSRGEELVTDRYPEITEAAARLPAGTVVDGEILAWDSQHGVLGFSVLQTRIGRKNLTRKIRSEAPIAFMAYDLLESDNTDIRAEPLQERRARLEELVRTTSDPRIMLSPLIEVGSWEDLIPLLAESRSRRVEGLMIKSKSSTYHIGRKRGDWWKKKVDPHTIDAVLVYAQSGSGKRASLYTDYTFAVWDGAGALVPFAKAYSGLTDDEIREVDRFIRSNTSEQFGPVRTVKPELVFELAFEAIQRSTRHKSGIAVRFPRILRWRKDKKAEEADSLKTIQAMLPPEPNRAEPGLFD